MLSNLHNRMPMKAGESRSSPSKNQTTIEPVATMVRIRQEVEMDYQSDSNGIPMGDLDKNSDVDVSIKGKPYDGYLGDKMSV